MTINKYLNQPNLLKEFEMKEDDGLTNHSFKVFTNNDFAAKVTCGNNAK